MNVKDVIEKHAAEIETAAELIEESANVIFPSDVKFQIGYDVLERRFSSESELFEFLSDFKEPGKKVRLSVLAVYDGKNVYSVVHMDEDGSIRFNMGVIKEITKDPVIVERIASLENARGVLGKAMEYIAAGLDRSMGRDPKNIKRYPLFDKIRYVRELVNLSDTVKKSTRKTIVYVVRNTHTPRAIKNASAGIMEEAYPSPVMEILAAMAYGTKIFSPFPFFFEVDVPEKGNVNEFGLSRYQAMGINDSKGTINGILGMAGSGKTFLAVKAMEFDSVAIAAMIAAGKEASSVYAIHSAETLERVKRAYPFMRENVLYFVPESELFVSDLERMAEKVENLTKDFPKERYEKLKSMFSGGSYGKISESMEDYLEKRTKLSSAFEKIISERDEKALYEAMRRMYEISMENAGGMRLFKAIAELMRSIFGERKVIYADVPHAEEVKRYAGINVSGMTEEEIAANYREIKRAVGRAISASRNMEKILTDEGSYGCARSVALKGADIRIEEALEFILLDAAYGKRGKENLAFLKRMIENPEEARKKENLEKLVSIFKFLCVPLGEMAGMEPSRRFLRVHVDEGYLFPGFSLYSVIGRGVSVNLYGDMNQFDVGMYFSLKDSVSKIIDLYGSSERVSKYSLTMKDRGIRSLFDMAEKGISEGEFTVLVDNFRSTEDIVEAQIHINPKYKKYIAHFLARCGDVDENENVSTNVMDYVSIYKKGVPVIDFPDGKTEKGGLWYTTEPDMKRRLSKVMKIAKINGFKEVIVTATFRKDILALKEYHAELLRENPEAYEYDGEISFLPMDALQSMEADFTHLESGMENIRSEGYRIARRHPAVINVPLTRSRTMFSIYVPEELLGEDELAYILTSFKRY